jgi:hypothetical protein
VARREESDAIGALGAGATLFHHVAEADSRDAANGTRVQPFILGGRLPRGSAGAGLLSVTVVQ